MVEHHPEQEEMTSDPEPRCPECYTHLPQRRITVRSTACWNCKLTINVSSGMKESLLPHRDGEIYPGEFTRKEKDFAGEHGVILGYKYSDVLHISYLGNVCPGCEHLQGNWYIYHDEGRQFSARVAEMIHCGPCDRCSKRYCPKHGNHYDYDGLGNCPSCLEELQAGVERNGAANLKNGRAEYDRPTGDRPDTG